MLDDCWLRPESEEACAQPPKHRVVMYVELPGQPLEVRPFGYSCGPHLAAAKQSFIFERNLDVVTCLLPFPRPHGTRVSFGFHSRETA